MFVAIVFLNAERTEYLVYGPRVTYGAAESLAETAIRLHPGWNNPKTEIATLHEGVVWQR